MYRDTMALRSNPFGPRIQLRPEDIAKLEFVTDLDRAPLRIDKCPELKELFCDTILDLREHMDKFHDLMIERDYDFEEPGRRGRDSALVVVRGARGAGKTTLGAWMVAEVAKLPGPQPLAVFHMIEPEEGTKAAFLQALGTLEDNLLKATAPGQHLAVLIENVTSETLSGAVALFERLRSRPRLFVLTTHNLKLLDADERTLGGSARIKVFTLRSVRSSDVDAYVAHRVPLFRDPERPEILQVSPVFPFRPGTAGRVVDQSAGDGEEGPVTLRVLNTQFRNKLMLHARSLRNTGHPSVENAPVESLSNYLLPDL